MKKLSDLKVMPSNKINIQAKRAMKRFVYLILIFFILLDCEGQNSCVKVNEVYKYFLDSLVITQYPKARKVYVIKTAGPEESQIESKCTWKEYFIKHDSLQIWELQNKRDTHDLDSVCILNRHNISSKKIIFCEADKKLKRKEFKNSIILKISMPLFVFNQMSIVSFKVWSLDLVRTYVFEVYDNNNLVSRFYKSDLYF